MQDIQEKNETLRVSLFSLLSREMLASIQGIVEFAKRIPGFCSLPQDDQLILIKTGFFEIWAVHVAPMSSKDTLTLSDGLVLNRKHLDAVYDVNNNLSKVFINYTYLFTYCVIYRRSLPQHCFHFG